MLAKRAPKTLLDSVIRRCLLHDAPEREGAPGRFVYGVGGRSSEASRTPWLPILAELHSPKGRDLGAWLGLVPKQISTGDCTILGKISVRGNRYLRVPYRPARGR